MERFSHHTEVRRHWSVKHPTLNSTEERRSQHLLSHAACPIFASFRKLDVAWEGALGRSFLQRDCHTQVSLLPQVTLAYFVSFLFLALLSSALFIHLFLRPLCNNTQYAMAASESIQPWLPRPKTIAFAVAVVKSRPPEMSIGGTYSWMPSSVYST